MSVMSFMPALSVVPAMSVMPVKYVKPVKMALYAASGSVSRQAEAEICELARKMKVELRIRTYARYADFKRDIHIYDIAAVHESIFFAVLQELNELISTQTYPADYQPNRVANTVVCMFKTPLSLKDFAVMMDKMPKQGALLDIPIPKGCKTESVSNILYFEIIDRKVQVRTRYETCITRLSMSEVKDLTKGLPFASPYVSFHVNLEWVQRTLDRDIVLKTSELVPMSQKKAALFKQALSEYNKNAILSVAEPAEKQRAV